MLVRPEDIEVGAVAAGWGQAQVERHSFLGDRVQLTLSMLDQDNLQADVGRDHPARLGETVGIRVQLERLISCDPKS